jgi:hypothetical protein
LPEAHPASVRSGWQEWYRREFASQNLATWDAKPAVQDGGVNRPEVDGVDEIAIIEFIERWRRAVETSVTRGRECEQDGRGTMVCPQAAILGHATTKLRERQQHDLIGSPLRVEFFRKRSDRIGQFGE